MVSAFSSLPFIHNPLAKALTLSTLRKLTLTKASSGYPPPPPPTGSLVQGLSDKPISRYDLFPYLIPIPCEGRKNLWTRYHSHDYGTLDGVMA